MLCAAFYAHDNLRKKYAASNTKHDYNTDCNVYVFESDGSMNLINTKI